jgi:hypothetical protein
MKRTRPRHLLDGARILAEAREHAEEVIERYDIACDPWDLEDIVQDGILYALETDDPDACGSTLQLVMTSVAKERISYLLTRKAGHENE